VHGGNDHVGLLAACEPFLVDRSAARCHVYRVDRDASPGRAHADRIATLDYALAPRRPELVTLADGRTLVVGLNDGYLRVLPIDPTGRPGAVRDSRAACSSWTVDFGLTGAAVALWVDDARTSVVCIGHHEDYELDPATGAARLLTLSHDEVLRRWPLREDVRRTRAAAAASRGARDE
jgi:hypothetical protein